MPKSFWYFVALSEMLQIPGKAQNAHSVTKHQQLQGRCNVESTKKPSFLAISCSSAYARLLVHARCPLIWVTWKNLAQTVTETERPRSFGSPEVVKLETELKISSRGKVKIRVEKESKSQNFHSFSAFSTLSHFCP